MAKQTELIGLQDIRYLEKELQVALTEQKLSDTVIAMETLERIYQRKLFKKVVLKYSVGVVAGMDIGYFLLKRK